MDTAIHKGRPFWSGVFDANDGFIREVHPYKRAKAADFHHSYYVSSQSQDAMKQGDAGFFWVDPDGSVNTDWREGSAPKHIVDAIQDQIEPIPHKDNGGSVGHIENHSSAIAEAMQNHFGVPVSVSKSKTPYGESHYVKPQFDLPKGETPFTVRVSDHAAWVPRLHQIEHQVYPKKGDDPEKFINESIDAAKKYGQRVGLFSKDEFVPLKGEVYHPAFGKGTIVDSQPDSAKVDFGDKGVKNISSRFLQEVPHKDNGGGITAYHGGPHFVGEESFLDEKIGTGEGAQAYGHGHYFAENEDVAKGYRDALTDTNPTARHYLNIAQGDQNKALELFDRDTSGSSSPQIEETKKHIQGQKGHMYEVHIDAHPDHFLDWDQPIHNQTKHVQNALSGLNLSAGKYGDTPLGAHIYGELAHKFDQHDPEMLNAVRDHPNQLAEAPELASALLHSKGIHGIKYLDAGSRSKGEGTRNYVVFDPKRVDIKRRYEQGGAASSPVKKNLI